MTGTITIRTLTAATALGAAFAIGAGVAGAASVQPTTVEGNPDCGDVDPGTTQLKYDSGAPGVINLTAGDVDVTLTVHPGGLVDWASTRDVAAVIVKGGPVANVYAYPGPADLADTGLGTALNPNNEQPYGLSHVTICVPPDVPETTTTTEPQETTTTTTPDESTTTTAPDESTTTVPDEPEEPEVQPDEEPATEVLGQTIERQPEPARSALPRTGAGMTLLAAAGASLVTLGAAARRTAARRVR